MKTHRFIGEFNIKDRVAVIDIQEIINQIKNVLKLKIGEQIILGDGNLNEKLVEISEINKNSIAGKIIKEYENKNEVDIYGILYCAILKKENFELVVQKATEIGISEIVPVITERTIKLNLNYERLEKIIKEAGEQSGRGKLPILQKAMKFSEAIEKARENDLNIFLDSSGTELKNINTKKLKAFKIGMFVGPEGGWTDGEKFQASRSKFQVISLGKLNLRAETAVIAGSYLILTKF